MPVNQDLALTAAQEAVDKVLIRARDLLCATGVWTQGASARDCFGKWVATRDEGAVQWSLDGALWRVADTVADAYLAGMCIRKLLNLPLEDPTALWAWGDAPGRTLDSIRRVLGQARSQIPEIVQGRTVSVTRAVHVHVPVPLEPPPARASAPQRARAAR